MAAAGYSGGWRGTVEVGKERREMVEECGTLSGKDRVERGERWRKVMR